MGSIFKFKRFEVEQAGCAMRINTDGVLIAAIASHDASLKILDIGTGTGVIAMILAQRFTAARIDAVEIDPSAVAAASLNFSSSPFASRLNVTCDDILDFESASGYDLIISNPPYFVNDLKNPELRKRLARHAGEDFFEGLIRKVAALLNTDGCFWVILPVKQAEKLIVIAVLYRLFAAKVIHVYSDESKPEIRQVVCFSFTDSKVLHENFYIYAATGIYTDAYVSLLKDFFLAF